MRALYFIVTTFFATAIAVNAVANTQLAPGLSGATGGAKAGISDQSRREAQSGLDRLQHQQDGRRAEFNQANAQNRQILEQKDAEKAEQEARAARSYVDVLTKISGFPSFYRTVIIEGSKSVKVDVKDSGKLVLQGATTTSSTTEKVKPKEFSIDSLAVVKANAVKAMADMPVSEKEPESEIALDTDGGRIDPSTKKVMDKWIRNLDRASNLVKRPSDVGAFASLTEKDKLKDAQEICGESFDAPKCFDKFWTSLGNQAGAGFKSDAAPEPSKAGTAVKKSASMRIIPHFFPSILFSIADAIAAATNDISIAFTRRVRGFGFEIAGALATADNAEGINAEGLRRSFDRFRTQNEGHLSEVNLDLGITASDKGTSYYRQAASIVVDELAPKSQAITRSGVAAWDKLSNAETALAQKLDTLQRERQAIRDELNKPDPKFPEAPIAANPESGGGGGGSPSGGGGSSAGGGAGGGKGVEPVKFGDPVKFSEFKAAPVGEGANPIGGTGPNPGRSSDRGALAPFKYNVPNINFAGNQPVSGSSRTKPLGLGSRRSNGDDAQPKGGSAGSLIGGGGNPSPSEPPGSGAGGGVPAVGKGAGGDGGGLGAMPNVGQEEGAGDRGSTNNFVRNTEYGSAGNGEGGAGAGPAADNTDPMIGPKGPPIMNGKFMGLASAEIKENKGTRLRGLGIMANVGNFAGFCGETKMVTVTLCDAASVKRTASVGQAFRAPASESVGDVVAAKLSGGGSGGAPRALMTITQ